ncbi:TonB-dependent receptor [Parabacteroides sp.]
MYRKHVGRALILALMLSGATSMNAQRITRQFKNVPLKTVLAEVEKELQYSIIYKKDEVNEKKQITHNFNDASLEEVLSAVLDNGLSYSVQGKMIVISKKEVAEPSATQQKQIIVKGIVKDENGEPVAGANVVEKGTANGTITDMDGIFSLSVSENAKLSVTYIGYLDQVITVGKKQTSLNIQLKEDTQALEEVLVVGYGTQKKVTLTGSVVALKGEEITKSPSINIANSLAGRLPGVIINNRSGEPGRDDPSIFIRGKSTTGNASPLILIDGVERGGLGELNPNDIENISVLKDASAAIYGARAANGVILVTTKRGAEVKPSINLSFNQGFSQSTRTPKMADSYTYAKVYNEIEEGEGRLPRYSNEELEKYRNGTDPDYPNTDWFDQMIKNVTPQHRVNLSVSGGNERVKYYLSLGESHQSGHFKEGTTGVRIYNLRSNIDVQVTKYLKVGVDLAGKINDSHYPVGGTNDIYSHIFLYLPTWQTYWPGTDKLMPNRDSENLMNRVGDASGYQDLKTTAMQSTLSFKLDIPWLKGLWLDGIASYDASFVRTKTFNTPAYVYYKDDQTGELYKGVSGKTPNQANLNQKYENPTNMYLVGKINYDQTFDVHHVGAMLGYEQTQTKGNFLNAYRSDFISTSIPEIFAGSSDKNKQSNDGSSSQSARQNIFGRFSYDYAGKYMAQFTFRRDGSPNFPENKRYGFFPSFSLGWRISEESFMKELTFLDNLKFRGSYGKMGNDLVDPFQYLTTYKFDSNYVVGGNDVTGLVQNGVPNPNITWEVAKTYNIGFDSRFWNGLLGVDFDYFKTRRSNILTKRSAIIPDYTGLKLPDENIGIVDNQGFEMVVSHENYANPLKYRIAANVSFARNKVIFSDEQPAAEPYQYATGRPIGSDLYYHAIGVFESEDQIASYPHLLNTQPGDLIYEDVNKDGEIDSRDRIRVNQTNTPEIVYSINTYFEYKGFDLSLLFQGQENAKQYFGDYFPCMSYSLGNFLEWRAEDRWSPENTKATMPRGSSSTSNNNTEKSTQWLFNAGFLRLKNLEFGYNLPKNICEKLWVQNLRLSFSANNLFIIYDHMKDLGFDPETSNYWYYPQQRTYNFGINLTF